MHYYIFDNEIENMVSNVFVENISQRSKGIGGMLRAATD